jgi:phosphopantothenoylcysteine decarboxylase/phosphopantothenate--cysteine ligase
MALIALGVTGGVGAYKAVEVARGLQKRGHDVIAIMTRSARRFVGPVTFEAITRRRVITDQWTPGANADIAHISVADDIALLLIAPATANMIAKLANGIADDFLSTLSLATRAPILLAPAMNSNMLAHDAVQTNLAVLTKRGVRFVDPGEGYLACGWIGKGRLAEPDAIVAAAEACLGKTDTLTGRRVLVTAGPTYEDFDPVRFIGNRSSGRMGYAVAEEARRAGAGVTLITGPTTLPVPNVEHVIRVRSAAEMRDAVMLHSQECDAVIMAAAVANFEPVTRASEKISENSDRVVVELSRTRDIIADLSVWRRQHGRERPLLVGFAAETHDVINRARAKRARKGIDLIVANDVSRSDIGFGVDENAVTLIGDGPDEVVPRQPKGAVARVILERVARLLSGAAIS